MQYQRQRMTSDPQTPPSLPLVLSVPLQCSTHLRRGSTPVRTRK